jgi:ATP-binding cassette subfamily B (MDR/TAP) protein 8
LINSIYKLLQDGINANGFETLYQPSLDLLKVYTAQSFFTFVYIYLLGVMGENIAKEMKVKLFSAVIKQDISFYDKSRSGELINR